MSVIDRSRIRDKIAFLRQNLDTLRQLAATPRHAFTETSTEFHAAVRLLQISIEAMIDSGSHIVSREGLGTPKTYAEVFELLARAGIVPPSFLDKARAMTRFRNRAVHLYGEVNADQVYSVLQHNLADFEEFIRIHGIKVPAMNSCPIGVSRHRRASRRVCYVPTSRWI